MFRKKITFLARIRKQNANGGGLVKLGRKERKHQGCVVTKE